MRANKKTDPIASCFHKNKFEEAYHLLRNVVDDSIKAAWTKRIINRLIALNDLERALAIAESDPAVEPAVWEILAFAFIKRGDYEKVIACQDKIPDEITKIALDSYVLAHKGEYSAAFSLLKSRSESLEQSIAPIMSLLGERREYARMVALAKFAGDVNCHSDDDEIFSQILKDKAFKIAHAVSHYMRSYRSLGIIRQEKKESMKCRLELLKRQAQAPSILYKALDIPDIYNLIASY